MNIAILQDINKTPTKHNPATIENRITFLKQYPAKQLVDFYKSKLKIKSSYTKAMVMAIIARSDEKLEDLGEVQKGITSKNLLALVDKSARKFTDKKQEEFIEQENKDDDYNILEGYYKGIYKDQLIERKIVLKDTQANFLVHYFFSGIRGALLFHGTGTGKTFTATACIKAYLKMFPNNNVLIITPPSLAENIIKSMFFYGIEIRDKRFEFASYEKVGRNYKNMIGNGDKISKTLIIVDEAHYIRTEISTSENVASDGTKTIEIKQNKRGHGVVSLCQKAHKTILMTATPFVNKLYDIENIIASIDGREPTKIGDFYKITTTLPATIDYFKYRISHFEVPLENKDPNNLEYPQRIQSYVGILLDDKNAEIYKDVIKGSFDPKEAKEKGYDEKVIKRYDYLASKEDKERNAFYNAARQISVSIGLDKIKHVMNTINNFKRTGKFIIYSTYTGKSDESKGQLNKKKPKEEDEEDEEREDMPDFSKFSKRGIEFLLQYLRTLKDTEIYKITGDETLTQRTANLLAYNTDSYDDNNNFVFKKKKILIISDAGTEGLDCKNTEGLFMMEPLYNEARTEQAIARAIRYKSHDALKNDWRKVNVYRYVICTMQSEMKLIESINKNKLLDVLAEANNAKQFKEQMKSLLKKFSDQEEQMQGGAEPQKEEKKEFNYTAYSVLDSDKKKEEYMKTHKKPVFKIEEYKGFKTKEERADYLKVCGLSTRYETQNVFNGMARVHDTLPGPELRIVLLSISKQATIIDFVDTLDEEVANVEDIKNPTIEEYINRKLNGNFPKIDKDQIKKVRDSNFDTSILFKEGEIAAKLRTQRETKLAKIKDKWVAKQLQQYFTPLSVLNKLANNKGDGYLRETMDLTNEEFINLRGKKLSFLEPTAGIGSIILHFMTNPVFENIISDYKAIEYDKSPRDILIQKSKEINESGTGITFNVYGQYNFLTAIIRDHFDVIVMNPPFNLPAGTMPEFPKQSFYDLDFVMRAYYLLKENGSLVAIVFGGERIAGYTLYKRTLDLNEDTANISSSKYFRWLYNKNAKVYYDTIQGWDGNQEGFKAEEGTKQSEELAKKAKSAKIQKLKIAFVCLKRTPDLYKKEIETNEPETYLKITVSQKQAEIAAQKQAGIIPKNEIKEVAKNYLDDIKDSNIINTPPPPVKNNIVLPKNLKW